MKKLKLYVWEEVLCDYTCGIIFALAHDEEEAKNLVLEKDGSFDSVRRAIKDTPEVFTTPVSFAVWGGG